MTDDEFIIIGGATDGKHGRASIVVSDRFTRGHSSHCDTYDNTILCGDSNEEDLEPDKFSLSSHSKAETSGGNFVVVEMEIWGFEPDNIDKFY